MVTVLAAIDGSTASSSVLDVARAVAASRNADIEALHVRNRDGPGAIVGPAGNLPLQITTGDPVAAIVESAARGAVVMVVLGVGVHTGTAPGHVAAAVLQRLTKPVITVPSHLARPLNSTPLRVLVAVDGTAATARAAADAARCVGAAELIALHVLTAATAPVYWDRFYYDYPNWCREFMQRYCQGTTVRVELRQGDVAAHILDAACAGDASLVALAWSRDLSPGRAGILTRVLADSPIPVLLFPAAGPRDVESNRPRYRPRGALVVPGAPSTARGRRRSARPASVPARPEPHAAQGEDDRRWGPGRTSVPWHPRAYGGGAGDEHGLLGQPGPCPDCGGNLRATFDGETTNFLCGTCGTCWHAELAWVHRVNPSTCPGCASSAVCAQARRPYGSPKRPARSRGDAEREAADVRSVALEVLDHRVRARE